MEILACDESLILCVKPVGPDAEHEMPQSLQTQLALPELPRCVHRLDKGVGGVMVYARTGKAAAELSAQIQAGDLKKTYLAVLRGVPRDPVGHLEDLLYHDRGKNKVFVVKKERRGVKRALLDYEVLRTQPGETGPLTLVRVKLITGRAHQIRVQFSSRGLPLLGDGRYGGGAGQIALWSHSLGFRHPDTAKALEVSCPPPDTPPWTEFEKIPEEFGLW